MLFTVLTLAQMFHVMAIRLDRESLFARGPYTNPTLFWAVVATMLLQGALIYVPGLQHVFELRPLEYWHLLVALALASIIFWTVETEKWVQRRRERTVEAAPAPQSRDPQRSGRRSRKNMLP
jgi:Ca2+-transporting ATPase